jgi:hypothetical protein
MPTAEARYCTLGRPGRSFGFARRPGPGRPPLSRPDAAACRRPRASRRGRARSSPPSRAGAGCARGRVADDVAHSLPEHQVGTGDAREHAEGQAAADEEGDCAMAAPPRGDARVGEEHHQPTPAGMEIVVGEAVMPTSNRTMGMYFHAALRRRPRASAAAASVATGCKDGGLRRPEPSISSQANNSRAGNARRAASARGMEDAPHVGQPCRLREVNMLRSMWSAVRDSRTQVR